MAKALELNIDTLTTTPPVPMAAQVKAQPDKSPARKKGREVIPKDEPREPLQVRWPAEDVKAAKLATLQMDFPTVSDFMLACFHAYMKTCKSS